MTSRSVLEKSIFIILILVLFESSLIAQSDVAVREMSVVGPKTEEIDYDSYDSIYYVSAEKGSDKTGNGTKKSPWKSLHYALSKLVKQNAGQSQAVLVSAGNYGDATYHLIEHVDLYGGFNPENWERDIFKYATTLSGENVRRVVVGANHARIDGFKIKNGLARSHGGGILCEDTSPVISNNFISDNFVLEPAGFDHTHIHQPGHHGGGIASLYNAVPVIRNNVICNNVTSIGCGGGVAFYGWLRMDNAPETRIEDNQMVGGLRPVVEHNVIFGNVSGINDVHRTRSSSGGGISCSSEARPIIRNNVVVDNRATGRSDAGGIYCENYSYPIVEGNWIAGNVSDDDGGGIYTMRMGHPLIAKNIIAGNWTTGGGVGGIRLSKEGRATITENIIVQNQSGGGVQCVDSYMELMDNIIMDNFDGGGVRFSQDFSYFKPSIIRNNIIWNNEDKAIVVEKNDEAFVVIENNNIDGKNINSKNYSEKLQLVDDGLKLSLTSLQWNETIYTTILTFNESLNPEEVRPGRIIRFNSEWRVIKEVSGNKIEVWGILKKDDSAVKIIEILPSYRFM